MFDQFTLGIEEEFQIVDPQTRELRSHVTEFLDEGRMILGEQIKPEMIQSMIEVGTGVCRTIQEARADISNLRGVIASLAEKNGLKIVAASTHPISRWQDQKIFDDERYELLVQELQTVARSLLIFGLHVHVGIPDRERQIHIMNASRYFLPHILALSTSSDRKNGLKIVAASTHPISRWQDQKIFDDERYELLVQELQTVARSLLIFGLHVHVGIPDRERQIHIMNASRYFLPHILALSTS